MHNFSGTVRAHDTSTQDLLREWPRSAACSTVSLHDESTAKGIMILLFGSKMEEEKKDPQT